MKLIKSNSLALLFALALPACTETDSNVVLGTLERDRITLTATASEIITAQPVREGSHVEQGELLVQLDTTLQQLAVNRVGNEIAQQQALLDQLRNGPRPEEIAAARARAESAEANRRESERDLERIRDLVSKQLAARADLDTAETRLEGNEARLRDAQAQLQLLLSGTREEQIRQAEAALAALQTTRQLEQRRLDDLTIIATRSGTLDSLPYNPGDRVRAGAELAIILSDQAPYARVYIPEPYRTAMKTGDTLMVHVDGSTTLYQGTIRWISADPAFTPYYALNSAERSRLVYLAEIQLPDSAAALPAGVPVQAELP